MVDAPLLSWSMAHDSLRWEGEGRNVRDEKGAAKRSWDGYREINNGCAMTVNLCLLRHGV